MLIFIFLSITLFLIGSMGLFLVRKHLLMSLISLEILILSININFIVEAIYFDDLLGIIFSLINLTSAASEVAIGLALCIIFFKLKGGISLDLITSLKS